MVPATQTPAETVEISPEALEVANAYLQLNDARKVADELDVPAHTVTTILARKEVQAYINHVFYETGFNNRTKIRQAMDAVLAKKFKDMDESDTGSTKDIADLLALSHKMTMESMAMELQIIKARQKEEDNIKNQVNVQINEGVSISDGTKYGALISKLLEIQ
jgi:hypothetical protein